MPIVTHNIRRHRRIPPTLPTPARGIFIIGHPGYSPVLTCSGSVLMTWSLVPSYGDAAIALSSTLVASLQTIGFPVDDTAATRPGPRQRLDLDCRHLLLLHRRPGRAGLCILSLPNSLRDAFPKYYLTVGPPPAFNGRYGVSESARPSTVTSATASENSIPEEAASGSDVTVSSDMDSADSRPVVNFLCNHYLSVSCNSECVAFAARIATSRCGLISGGSNLSEVRHRLRQSLP